MEDSKFGQYQDVDIDINNASSYKDIFLRQLSKIISEGSKEMRGGYTSHFESKNGTIKEQYTPDSRETYCNSILSFVQLLKPKFDKDTKKICNDFDNALKELQDDFIKKSSTEETIILCESFYEDIKDKLLLEEYRMRKLQLFRDLFDNINKWLKKVNWLEIGDETY